MVATEQFIDLPGPLDGGDLLLGASDLLFEVPDSAIWNTARACREVVGEIDEAF